MVHLYQEQEGRGQNARWQHQEQLALFSYHPSQLGGDLPRAFYLETPAALECCRSLSTSLTHQLCSSTCWRASSTALQAAQAYFLGPQASRIILASPRAERNDRVCSHVTPWRDRETTSLCSFIVLEKPKSCALTWLPVPRAAGSPAEESWQCFQLQSQHPLAGDRSSGHRGSHCWCPQGLSSTGASPWVSLPGAELWPLKMCGAAPRG